ncbi:unnamed protein product [Plutella xylostella]|uniref:La-related protein 7 n=1 Tax=Plutella xylostella TaxID=51655 RepID=A0A8S4EYC3_PLUXY|nr:unnamed protein product [Plutella xylostella]
MSESSATENVDKEQEAKAETATRKRTRHRKKLLYEKILKQMEFYFSDANLSKDRLLSSLMKEDMFVPIDVFLKFNKIRAMTNDPNHIAKAMKNSTLLELSDDKTKVRRKVPLIPYDSDSRTVYVESIPVTASREWLERVFSEYGTVAYISLPKFKDSQRIKGYAFVEFNSPEDAQTCISAFTKMGCKLPTCMPPEELSSIKTFSVVNAEGAPVVDNLSKEDYEPPKKKSKKVKDKKPVKTEVKGGEEEPDGSEKKVETSAKEEAVTPSEEEVRTTDAESKYDTSQDEGKTEGDGETPRKKKRKKRTNKDKSKTKSGLNDKEASRGALWGLQVLAKCEWKALRNKYLNLQRLSMKNLKRELRSRQPPAPAPPAAATAAPHEPEPEHETFEKGVFLAGTLPTPCIEPRETKQQLKANKHILHVEVREGQNDIMLRFDTPAAANEWLVSSGESIRARPLTEAEEGEERARWLRAQTAPHRRRPRQRLQARAAASASGPAPPQPTATHIRFDEDDAH